MATLADPGRGPSSPLFLDQTEAWRAEKIFWDTGPPLLSQGLDLALGNAKGFNSPIRKVIKITNNFNDSAVMIVSDTVLFNTVVLK